MDGNAVGKPNLEGPTPLVSATNGNWARPIRIHATKVAGGVCKERAQIIPKKLAILWHRKLVLAQERQLIWERIRRTEVVADSTRVEGRCHHAVGSLMLNFRLEEESNSQRKAWLLVAARPRVGKHIICGSQKDLRGWICSVNLEHSNPHQFELAEKKPALDYGLKIPARNTVGQGYPLRNSLRQRIRVRAAG